MKKKRFACLRIYTWKLLFSTVLTSYLVPDRLLHHFHFNLKEVQFN